jgi:hypothetical protein
MVAVGFVAVSVGQVYKRDLSRLIPEALPMPSTYNDKQSGMSAFYELCQKLKLKPRRWELPYRNLKAGDVKGTLVIIDPQVMPNDLEINQIIPWVKAGNDLIFLDKFGFRSGRHLLNQLGVDVHESKAVKDAEIALTPTLAEAAYARHLVIDAEARLDGGEALAADDSGTYLAVVQLGGGRCLIGCCPDLCANVRLSDRKYWPNFQFMTNWLATSRKEVIFDEKAQGYSSGSSMFVFLAKSPVGFVCLELIILFLVAAISLNQRFGLASLATVYRKISNLEFIDGMASTYLRARARDTVWAMIFNPFKAKLCKALAVAPHESADKLAMAWSESSRLPFGRCQTFLTRAQYALEANRISKEELKFLVSECNQLASGSAELVTQSQVWGA